MDFTPYRITKTEVIETGTKARGQPVMPTAHDLFPQR